VDAPDASAIVLSRMPRSPELVITAAPSRHLGAALREVWLFRGTVRAFAERDIRVKYKQSVLGIAWAVIQPLAFMLVFTLTIGHVAGVHTGEVPYAAFSLSALVPWTFLSTAVSFGANAVLTDAAMVRRVYFPREVPVVAAVAGSSLDFAIGLALFAVIGPLVGAHVTGWWLLAPLLFLPLALVAAAIATPLAALNVYYRDFRFALPFALQFWLFASPVAYPITVIPSSWRGVYAFVNPAAGILAAFSSTLAEGTHPAWTYLGASVASTVVLGTLGYLLFKRLEPNFADVI
jgi:homopolymeric O-antigen transport system permease protein